MDVQSIFMLLSRWRTSTAIQLKEHLVTILLISFSIALISLVAGAAIAHFFVGVDIPHIQMRNHTTAQYWGQLGDFVGGMLNPILSFAALMAVLYSLTLQRKELANVRLESIEANRIQNSQTAIYRRQGVESSLLELIGLHSKITNDVVITAGVNQHCGRAAFNYLDLSFREVLVQQAPKSVDQVGLFSVFKQVQYKSVPKGFYSQHSSELSRYMRSIFQVMKFIDTRVDAFDVDDPNEKKNFRRFTVSYLEKREFSSIFRAQLDQRELQLIFLNIMTPEGRGLKFYVEKYSLLKGMNLSLFSSHQELFDDIHQFAFADYEDIDLPELYAMDVDHKRSSARAAFQRKRKKDLGRIFEE